MRSTAMVLLGVVLAAAACGSTEDRDAQAGAASSLPTSTIGAADVEVSELRAGVPDQPAGWSVGYYGDSLAHSAQDHVIKALDSGLRFRVLERTFPGTALCDWSDEIDQDVEAGDLWAAVLLFSNNSFTPCMADESGESLDTSPALEKFQTDLEGAVARFRGAGVRVYLPTLPRGRQPDDGEITALNGLLVKIAADDDGVIVVDAAAAVLGPDGEYVEVLPCLPIEPCVGGADDNGVGVNLVREPDGTHFCSGGFGTGVDIQSANCPVWSSGAFRYAAALTAPIVEDAYTAWAADPASRNPRPDPVD